jgi:UDP-N-acetylmuramyl pentapeptide phosphotransferase/UDP-N-acetylglucosamine-1-phosphate transferase
LWPLLLAGSPAFAFGLLEDLTKRVSVRTRLAATLSCGVLGWALTGYSIIDVNIPGVDWLLSFTVVSVAFTAFAAGGMANALNIVDGINGLASGTVLIILCGFAMMSNALGDVDLLRTSLIMGGAVLGFALLNWPMGKIFLGDGGAYFLGFSVSWLAVLMLVRHSEISAWSPMVLCCCPALEVLFTMLRRWRRRRNLGAPDSLHLHSLIRRRLTRRLLPNASSLMQNSATGFIMCVAGVLPAYIAVHWATDTLALMLGFAFCALLYSSFYARLTQFRWCIRAFTLRQPSAVSA